MKTISLRQFQLHPTKYILELPLIITRYSIPIAQIVSISSLPIIASRVKRVPATIENITLEQKETIASEYKVPLAYVNFELEQLRNYCLSNGKQYKNYTAALRTFVLRGMKKHIERRFIPHDTSKNAVDARNII